MAHTRPRTRSIWLAALVAGAVVSAACGDAAGGSGAGGAGGPDGAAATAPDGGTATMPDGSTPTAGAGTAGGGATEVRGDPVEGRYDLRTDGLEDIWVDPVNGDDGADGRSRDRALRTLAAAWDRVPADGELRRGVRLALTAGRYDVADAPNYWEARHGTAEAPIVLQAVDGRGTAELPSMNVFGVAHLALVDVRITSEFDPFHCEQCDHLLLRGVELRGTGDRRRDAGPQETLKVNQSSNVYVEDADIHGATDNALDFVAVQYGHIVGSRIGGANDWCAYVKGGSAYLVVDGNTFADCGTGGFTAGQGTGFQFMRAPWVTYEASWVKVTNNLVHDTEGAAFGVAGAANVVFAHNTAARVGTRAGVVDIVFGRRGCDGAPDDADAVGRCRSLLGAGGWGTIGEELEIIPNHDVWFLDNVIVNPDNAGASVHFQAHGCTDAEDGTNVPASACAFDGLRIEGNVIANGSAATPLFEAGTGCATDGAPCTEAGVQQANAIGPAGAGLRRSASGDDLCGLDLPAVAVVAVAPFGEPTAPGLTGLPVPEGWTNAVSLDRGGRPRPLDGGRPGAC